MILNAKSQCGLSMCNDLGSVLHEVNKAAELDRENILADIYFALLKVNI